MQKQEKSFVKGKERKSGSESSRKSIYPQLVLLQLLSHLSINVNVNFASEEAKPLIELLKRTLNLTMNNDSREGTTRYGTPDGCSFLTFS
ncbi:hypothetical protein TNCV_1651381 [Trichonephila clavipes]|nr:hypothetical protein TNCV_1651381 [Trichonephila clavipes]